MTSNVRHLPWHANDQLPSRDERDWVTSIELIEDAGITYRQADYWTRTALLAPLEAATPGSGHLRRFPEPQIARAVAINHLLAAGVSLVTIRDVIDDFLEHGSVRLGAITITHHPQGAATA